MYRTTTNNNTIEQKNDKNWYWEAKRGREEGEKQTPMAVKTKPPPLKSTIMIPMTLTTTAKSTADDQN